MRHLKIIAGALAIAATPLAVAIPAQAVAAVPGSTSAVNVDENGLALKGYDPVGYFDGGKPVKGSPEITTTIDGVRYQFASEEHRKAFVADPARYSPQFGGFCAVGTSYGEKVDADPETGRVVDDKLYVNYSPKVQQIFDKDVPGTIKRAEQNWPTVKNKAQ